MKRTIRIVFILFIIAVASTGILIFMSELLIVNGSKKYIFNETAQLPDNQVTLVLGTSQKLANGNENLFFKYRMQAAKELYNNGKVKAFVLSGDNHKEEYNEPEDMRQSLIKQGIPEDKINLDYAGFRTLDSVIRMNKIFGQDTFIVVSQKFHNQRAVYIARKNGLEAYGYNAKDVPAKLSFKTFVRERFARVKVFIDLLINKTPKFLGEPVEINL